MDNPLTPNKIQRLIHLAEDRSFNVPRRLLLNDEDVKRFAFHQGTMNKSSANTNCESSSGILDLDKVEAFGECGIGNMSLSKSTAFNPGEMTGRSTGAEDVDKMPVLSTPGYEEYGRHSLALDNLQSHMDKQTLEINDIMRHSIATNYSFHSKRDLTADEASLVIREAPLPVTQSAPMNFQDSLSMNQSNMSVGAYFKNRCPEFGRILTKTESPDRPLRPSISDVSINYTTEPVSKIANNTFKLDSSLDSIPVRQPKVVNNETMSEKLTVNSNMPGSVKDKPSISVMNMSNVKNNMEPPKSVHVSKALNASGVNSVQGSGNTLNQMPYSKGPGTKSFMTSAKPTDVLLRNLQSSLRMVAEDTEGSTENSLSISKIADYLGRQSNVSVTDMLQLNNQTKQPNRKQPLTELHLNLLENKRLNQDVVVTQLKDTRKVETASSSGTMNTVISLDKLKIKDQNEIPEVIVTRDSGIRSDAGNTEPEDVKTQSVGRSKSPSSKSQSTLSTVQENVMSFKSGESPTDSRKGEYISNIPSPNVGYRELDNSVDWLEVLQQKQMKEECLTKEKWADIQMSAVNGFVGVSCPVTITVSTLTDSWLTARIEFNDLPNRGKDLTIELPRLPLLLSPGKTEQFNLHLTSNIEMATKLPFTVHLKDASIDGDTEQKGYLEVNIKMPAMQALSCDGVNNVTFPVVQEKTSVTKYFVLLSDCPVDLKLELAITEGDSMFVIKNVQEIKRNEVSKALMDRQSSLEEQQMSKSKGKGINKQLCRLTNENAIKVTITFNAPKLSELGLNEEMATFKGTLNVNLIGGGSVLKRVSITGSAGTARLAVQTSADKLHIISNEAVSIPLTNTGSASGCWVVKVQGSHPDTPPFRVAPARLVLPPGGTAQLNVAYTGGDDGVCETTLILEDVVTGMTCSIEISGGTERPKMFPIKTNLNCMSWVRAGRKELSLKNFSDRKVQLRCQIVGDGFAIDLPGMESRGVYCLAFGACECRPLPIVFTPTSVRPHVAALHIVFDKNCGFSRKIKLHGCAESAGGGAGAAGGLRWAGLVTYGDTALVRAQCRQHVDLPLYNKSQAPAFVAARVHFNVQYACMESHARLSGARCVVGGRARHALSLRLEWARLERRARAARSSALATVTVLTGTEYTRRRILRILKSESQSGELDTSLLPDHLKVLTEKFDGEDPSMDKHLENFRETKLSLTELIESLQELTAQIDLPQDFADDNTIVISDDTMVEHHTLCD